MKKKYNKPEIKIKKIRINLFLKRYHDGVDFEGLLLTGCTCNYSLPGMCHTIC